MKVNLYSVKGEEKGKVNLPDDLFAKRSFGLLSQALRFYEFGLHKFRPKRKTRSDVNASKRKVYRQKGTGRARHGAVSAPIFVGGGLAHGPSGTRRLLRLPNSIKRRSRSLSLLDKLKEGKMVLVENLSSFSKTKEAYGLLTKLLSGLNIPVENILVVFRSEDKDKWRAWSNITGVKIGTWDSINAFEVFNSRFLLLDSKIFETNKKKVIDADRRTEGRSLSEKPKSQDGKN